MKSKRHHQRQINVSDHAADTFYGHLGNLLFNYTHIDFREIFYFIKIHSGNIDLNCCKNTKITKINKTRLMVKAFLCREFQPSNWNWFFHFWNMGPLFTLCVALGARLGRFIVYIIKSSAIELLSMWFVCHPLKFTKIFSYCARETWKGI